ncbi:MAG: recombinase family protein [Clostridia bacterium]
MPTSSTAYAIYLRKSRADFEAEQSGSGETLARHRSILTKLAIHNHHLIGHIYQEIVSGETIADRPEVRALLQDVSAGKWQGVYVMEVERLARGDTMDQGLVAHAFKIAGTYIITPHRTPLIHPMRNILNFPFSCLGASTKPLTAVCRAGACNLPRRANTSVLALLMGIAR